MSQIGTITADNAANMVAAFKVIPDISKSLKLATMPALLKVQDSEEEDLSYNDEDMEEFDLDENLNDILYQGLTGWNHAELKRNGCLAHLLQLAIKDAMKTNALVPKLTRRVNEMVTFFSKSPMWKDALRTQTNGLLLIKPIEVRWNSTYNCFKRIIRKDDKVIIIPL